MFLYFHNIDGRSVPVSIRDGLHRKATENMRGAAVEAAKDLVIEKILDGLDLDEAMSGQLEVADSSGSLVLVLPLEDAIVGRRGDEAAEPVSASVG